MRIVIGMGSCGIAAGAARIGEYLRARLAQRGLRADVSSAGCAGLCYLEPMMTLREDSGGETTETTLVRVTEEAVDELVKRLAGEPDGLAAYALGAEDEAILRGQERIVLRNCGVINPEELSEYIEAGGYAALKMTLESMTPQEVIDEVKAAGLAGRGGAGFPTWFKWQAARNAPGGEKYVICNADEGDPGAFMDRALIESDPHSLIEGMLIAAYAVGAGEGVIYARAEYPLAIKRLERAIEQAREKGILGQNALGAGAGFSLRVKAGAGAFVCGEETALIASLEGERGMPRLKPPYPAQSGLWGKPTNINNVETYANVPWIIRNGGAAFAALGTARSRGTKVFALTGKIAKGGLVEIPMGRTVRDVVEGVGGGVAGGRALKAVQMGGPSGGCIPEALADTVIDYDALAATGAIMGSGGMVVMDDTTCMVDVARFFLDFTRKESCGKCVHCRIGTKRMLEILERITEGRGREGDVELLEALGEQVREGALCGLGATAPNPVLTTLKYFRHEYEDHILRKKCAAKHCKPLLTFGIDGENCRGCGACVKACPAGAISGQRKEPHRLNGEKCVKCGNCRDACRFGAVTVD